MKTIKEINEMVEAIERLPAVSEVVIGHEKIIITTRHDDIMKLEKFQEKLKEIVGEYPTPCDVNIKDWFVYF
jgi:hypothetical protein